MTMLIDTSVWSLALRRDRPPHIAHLDALQCAISGGEIVVTTGIILQELLQGFTGAKQSDAIISRFSALPFVKPRRTDYIDAAILRNSCRKSGVQLGTIDALLAQICIQNKLTLLTTDNDFVHAAKIIPLNVWQPS